MRYSLRINRQVRGLALHAFQPSEFTGPETDDGWDNDHSPESSTAEALQNRIFALETALQKAREEAFQAGFQEGRKTMESELRRKMEEMPAEFARITKSLQEQYRDAILKMKTSILRFAFKIARKIMASHLQLPDNREQLLESQIQRFLEAVVEEGRVTIYVNPSQLNWINRHQAQGGTAFSGNINFKPRHSLKPGECLLETDDYIVDGTINGQLERIEKEIFD